MREARFAVILVAIALIATGAQAAAGLDVTTTVTENGTHDYINVNGGDLTLDGDTTVSLLDANGDEIGGALIVGSAGGTAVTANLTVNAGVTLTLLGSTTNDGEGETHGMDIGGQSAATAYFGPGSFINAGGMTMAIGMDAGWYGFTHPITPALSYPDSGYDTTVHFDSMTIDNHDGISIGLGQTIRDANILVKFTDTTISGMGWTSLFVVGGTVEISGTLNTQKDRIRSYAAKNVGMNMSQANDAGLLAVIKFTGVNPLWKNSTWMQTGQFKGTTWALDANGDQIIAPVLDANGDQELDANGDPVPDAPYKIPTDISDSTSREFGFAIDISDATIPTNQWYSLVVLGFTGDWTMDYGKIIMAPGSEGLLRMHVPDPITGTRSIQVWIPEPATMTMLGLGGLGVLLRRKRR